MKKIAGIFLVSFALNVVWENLHSFFYANYMGGKITEFILIRASLADAAFITVISLPFIFLRFYKNRAWLIVVIGTIVAIFNEWFGLKTARWAYNELMPIIPFIKTGITPTIQLGLLAYISLKVQHYFR